MTDETAFERPYIVLDPAQTSATQRSAAGELRSRTSSTVSWWESFGTSRTYPEQQNGPSPPKRGAAHKPHQHRL